MPRQYVGKKNYRSLSRDVCILSQQWFRHTSAFCQSLWFILAFQIHVGIWQLRRFFGEANIVFIVITSAKIFPRWLFPSKIYIRFTILNTYFSTKLSFTIIVSPPVEKSKTFIRNYIFKSAVLITTRLLLICNSLVW